MKFRVNSTNSALAPAPVLSNSLALDFIAGKGAFFIGDIMKCELCNEPRLDSGDYPRLCLNHKRERKAATQMIQRRSDAGLLRRIYSEQKIRSKNRNRPAPNYSLDDLFRVYLNDRRYQRLHAEWVKSEYATAKRPCLDRINCLQPYTLRNIHILTIEENRYKCRMEARRSHGIPVAASKAGVPIREYPSILAAGKDLVLRPLLISECLRDKSNTYGGYDWQYI